jgi:cytochrome c-type biogenesis protein CcsB
MIKKILTRLFSTGAAGLYMILFAVAIGAATFIENDFGTSAAQKLIFKAKWFELLLVLFGMTIIFNIDRFKMVRNKKWPLLIFHASIIVILLGAAVTRYVGYEGSMHIREDDTSNTFISAETYLNFKARQNGKMFTWDEQVHFASLGRNRFSESYQIGNDLISVELEEFIPNPTAVLEPSEQGAAVLKLVIAGQGGREEYFLTEGDFKNLNGTWFNFGNPEQPQAVNIYFRNNTLEFKGPDVLTQMQMATQQRDTVFPDAYHPLLVKTLYSNEKINFVIGDFSPKATVLLKAGERKITNESIAGLRLNVTINGESSIVHVYGNKGMEGQPQVARGGGTELAIAYGAKTNQLPFALKLRDFQLDKYPGTNSAMSYASEVTLIDKRNNVNRNERIFMNNILDYDGYRFFQSSFDQDELGTVLSVNHDFWGTWISYIGYALLTIGMLMTLVSKRTRFHELSKRLREMQLSEKAKATASIIVLLLSTATVFADNIGEGQLHIIPKAHADNYSRLIVQDHKGRMKPANTLSSEVLRKVSRKEELFGLNPDQVFLGMTFFPEEWAAQPMIKIGSHESIRALIKPKSELAAFNEFFTANGQYILKEHVRAAYGKASKERTIMDKELLKIDERVNICNMIFTGSMARLYPVANHPDDLWLTPSDVVRGHNNHEISAFARQFFGNYANAVLAAFENGNWSAADQAVTSLHDFQQKEGGELVISDSQVNMEILLNKMNVFSRLSKYYGLLGLLFLGFLFTKVFRPNMDLKWPLRISLALLAIGFTAHTAGLGIRWYVSGRAPWSNGYESMIYIGFTTVLAGMIFARKSIGGLTATAILASTILMVAGLSWLDPEITPLVPVLRSYWLTIHVSMEAGSYGFLMLGAIIGLLNLAIMICLTSSNKDRLTRMIKEMTMISEMTLIGGLFMISIGTYLGGVWANESWGRYWGWDAKETWALVTTLVYAFILHMRFIPGVRGLYAFNVASLFGFASVMMTYFGVNYYLSGLHSYAAGDPVPIPPSVYYTAVTFTAISLLAYWKKRRVGLNA